MSQLLGLVILFALVVPGGGASAGWNPATVEAFARLEAAPGQVHSARLQNADGSWSRVKVAWGETWARDTYQAQLDAWVAALPGRLVPSLGDSVQILNRYTSGRPISGAFLGFDGPLLVLEVGQRRAERWWKWEGLEVVDGAHAFSTGVGPDPAHWPPSRRPLMVAGPTGVRAVWPQEIQSLRIAELGRDDLPMLLVLGCAGLLWYGFAHMEFGPLPLWGG